MKTFLYCFKATIVFVFLLTPMMFAQNSAFNWSIKGGGTGRDYGNAIAIDSHNNIYLTGEFSATATFDTISIASAGNVDYFLVKFDSSRAALWAKKGGGTLTDRGYGVVVDKDDNVITTGHLYGTAIFDGVSLTSAGNLDAFTAKYSPNGTMLWIKQGTGVSQVSSRSVAVDTAGNIIVVGYFGTTNQLNVAFDAVTLTSNGLRDAYIVKYDPDGNVLWARNGGGINSGEEAKDVAVDLDGNIYVTGIFVDSASFDTQKIYGNGGSDIFVTKYDKDGQILWVTSAGGDKTDEGRGIAIDKSGKLYVGGTFDSAAVFGVDTFFTAGNSDAFIAEYDADGNFVNIVIGGGTDNDYCNDIAVDTLGNVYGIGQFRSTATFNTTNLASSGLDDILFFKYSSTGGEWFRAGGTDVDRGLSLAVDNNGNLYGTGYFKLTSDFGNTNLVTTGGEDAFITNIGEIIVPVELVSFSASSNTNNIILSWKTATELNNSGFEIQRSKDGITFAKIGFVEGKGTTTRTSSYSFADKSPYSGKSYYRLKQIDFDGTYEYSKVVETGLGLPSTYKVSENYPNPFNPSTNVRIELPVQANVTLKLYNSIGQIVKIYDSQEYAAGSHILRIDASDLSSGVYYYSVQMIGKDGSSNLKTSKMILLK